MVALNPFNSKMITLTPRGGLWTFSAILAHCAPPLCVACFAKKAFCNTLLLIVCVHLLHQNCKSRSTSSSTRSRRLRGEGGIPNAELIAILIANYLALFISCWLPSLFAVAAVRAAAAAVARTLHTLAAVAGRGGVHRLQWQCKAAQRRWLCSGLAVASEAVQFRCKDHERQWIISDASSSSSLWKKCN